MSVPHTQSTIDVRSAPNRVKNYKKINRRDQGLPLKNKMHDHSLLNRVLSTIDEKEVADYFSMEIRDKL